MAGETIDNPGANDDVRTHDDMLELVQESGWFIMVAIHKGRISGAFYRDEGSRTDSLGDMVSSLGLYDKKRNLKPGFDMGILPGSAKPLVRYNGPPDLEYERFLDALVEQGQKFDPKP